MPRPPVVQCHQCSSTNVHIERGQTKARVRGTRRTVARATCRTCGWEWFSAAKQALKASRAKDRAAPQRQSVRTRGAKRAAASVRVDRTRGEIRRRR